jgi:hypothetical protein
MSVTTQGRVNTPEIFAGNGCVAASDMASSARVHVQGNEAVERLEIRRRTHLREETFSSPLTSWVLIQNPCGKTRPGKILGLADIVDVGKKSRTRTYCFGVIHAPILKGNDASTSAYASFPEEGR